ncbi:ferritin [Methanomicrobiaceae archaeon CYW5]|nr:ferritin [Methanovulcanius yangii]MBT8508935.1 ferritin [Methanovulcanius yangii]
MKKEEYRSILSGAIEKEVESYTFYREIESCTNDETLKKIFGELADEERKHRETLEEFLTKPIKSLEFDEAQDYKISETLELPTMTTEMKPADGIALAIKKEELSRDMYRELAELSTGPQQKQIFTNLANMESHHKARLEDIFTNMAFPEVW